MSADYNEGSRRERKKERTRQTIVDAALALFQKQGFETTTMEQIAEEADIAKGTLYNHFPSKEAIIGEYMHYVIRDNKNLLQQIINECADTKSRLLTLMKMMSKWNEQNRDLVKVHTTSRLQDLFMFPKHRDGRQSNLELILTQIISLGQKSGELRGDFGADKLAKYFKAMYIVPFVGWLVEDDQAANEQSIEETIDIFISGVKMSGGAGDGTS